LKRPVSAIERTQEERDEPGRLLFQEKLVRLGENDARLVELVREGVDHVFHKRGDSGRLHAVAAYVADENGDPPFPGPNTS